MKTLPREPWRGGQICGWQIGYGLPHSIFCGELKKPGSPLCEYHDEQERLDNYGQLPKFARGNVLGLAAYRRSTMPYMFQLSWETKDPRKPQAATEEEIRAWQAS